ncbi:sodium-dependent transporter [Sphingorhabdus sp. Alg239-R122]|uniref:sodium-dependent transporter n=1 Tax=Sphingorhabdus sp. Alg239-R122 TaxID=2305989 RepID=UPI0013DB7569|nr:sodium-dependent transporter [Sphingorhabdus sp. Alg239-R122]
MVAGAQTDTAEGWSSRTAFVLAAVGAAVGLGNLWRFPTLAGESGGGAFVLVYVGCVILIGLPLVLSEILIGRAGRSDAVDSVRNVAKASGISEKWQIFGWFEIIAAFFILTFYSVVAGWVIYYIGVMLGDFLSALGAGEPLRGALAGETSEQITGRMGALFENVPMLVAMHTLFMLITIGIVAQGVTDGIEKAAMFLMPAFFVLLVLITIYGAFTGDFGRAAEFLFTPDFSKLSAPVINEALGQALFSMSLGSAALMTYGAYVSRDTKLGPTAGMIGFADTGVAIIAGLMIFPIVFAAGLDPAGGPTLVFQSLPIAFQNMPAGSLIGLLFFVLIFFAALTSSISLLEGPTAWAKEAFGWSRSKTAWTVGLFIYVVGIACALSLSIWSDVRLLPFWDIFADQNIFDTIDGFTGKILLPTSALLTAIFVGWRADRKLVDTETGLEGSTLVAFRFLVAWVCPIAVGLILLFGIFPELLTAIGG